MHVIPASREVEAGRSLEPEYFLIHMYICMHMNIIYVIQVHIYVYMYMLNIMLDLDSKDLGSNPTEEIKYFHRWIQSNMSRKTAVTTGFRGFSEEMIKA